MKVYTIESKQKLPVSAVKCWDFFSDPKNLQEITPPDLNFSIQSELPGKMYPGQIIRYRIKVFPVISVNWVTEITHVREHEFFVDEQRFGPYKFWHHQHFFREVDGGMEIYDIVHYAIPFGFIGRIVHALMIKNKLKKIFDFRRYKLSTGFQ